MSPVAAVDSADSQTVFGIRSGSPLAIVRFSPDGSQTPFFTGPEVPPSAEALIAVAFTGRVFVAFNAQLLVVSPTATLEATLSLPGYRQEDAFVAVASDSCTVFYSKSVSIGRLNGCTGEVLPDFPGVTYARDVHPLPDGRLLVADDGDIILYGPIGTPLRYLARLRWYDIGEGHSPLMIDRIALASDGRSLWFAAMPDLGCHVENGFLIQVSLDDGSEMAQRSVLIQAATGLVAGGAPATAPAIPSLSALSLLLLALTLASAALFLLRR